MTEEEKLREAVLVGAKILIEQGLNDWKIKLSNKRTTLADCNRTRKTIRFSKHFVKVASKDEFIGVAYHEVAHALLPTWTHHGPEFVKKCIEISPTPDYATRNHPVPIQKFNTVCPECGTKGGSNRKRNGICRPCSVKGLRIPVKYSLNNLAVTAW
jgi:predicted SprT family Zn-dependent metalloprotease